MFSPNILSSGRPVNVLNCSILMLPGSLVTVDELVSLTAELRSPQIELLFLLSSEPLALDFDILAALSAQHEKK